MRLLALLLVVVLCVGCPSPVPSPAPVPVPAPGPVPPSDVSVTTKALLVAHNNERQKSGASPILLTLDSRLTAAAEWHARWMAANNKLSHESPSGSHIDRIKDTGYKPRASGENIAMGYSSVAEVMSGWMNSPGHRRNLLNLAYVDCGFGMVVDSRGRKWWVAVFADPKVAQSQMEEFGSPDSTPPGIVTEAALSDGVGVGIRKDESILVY